MIIRRCVGEWTLEQQVYVTAAGKMIILHNDPIDAIKSYTARLRCLEQVISLYLQLLDVVKLGEIELSDGIDFIIQYIERIHIAKTIESVLRYHAEIGFLQRQHSYASKITKRERLQWVEIHEGELKDANRVETGEWVGLDLSQSTRQVDAFDIR